MPSSIVHILRSAKRHWPLCLTLIFFIWAQLHLSPAGISLSDEGFLLENARLIKHGLIPYRDFFLTTTPGIYYLHALLLALFGDYTIITRYAYIVVICLILILTYLILKHRNFRATAFLIPLAILYLGIRQFAFYNEASLALYLLAFWLFGQIRLQSSPSSHFSLGTIAFLAFFVKQSVGIWLWIILIICYLSIPDIAIRARLKRLVIFMAGLLLPSLIYAVYLTCTHALPAFVYYVFGFAAQVKAHQNQFVIHRLALVILVITVVYGTKNHKLSLNRILITGSLTSMVYLLSQPTRIGRLITYFNQPDFYYDTLLFTFCLLTLAYCLRDYRHHYHLFPPTLFNLGLFFAMTMSGVSLMTTIITTPLLFITLSAWRPLRLPKTLSVLTNSPLIIFLLLTTYLIRLIFLKVLYVTPYPYPRTVSSIPALNRINLQPWYQPDLDDITKIVRQYHPQHLLCFPYCPMINFVTGIPSPSFYSFFYQETFPDTDQSRVIHDLTQSPNTLILIQQTGDIEPNAHHQDLRLNKLKQFLLNAGTPIASTSNFYIRYHK